MRILLIDNYDSFTWNLAQYLGELNAEVEVVRNDAIDLTGVGARRPDRIVISPGPCTPKEAGISVSLIQAYAGRVPLLGVCLGHQSIGAAFGGTIGRARRVMHGKTSTITHNRQDIFAGIPSPYTVIRYHSLVIERASLPSDLSVMAESDDGEIMAVRHKTLPVWGVQFHPESILTEHGHDLLRNFLSI